MNVQASHTRCVGWQKGVKNYTKTDNLTSGSSISSTKNVMVKLP
jgi:hypothetical protein